MFTEEEEEKILKRVQQENKDNCIIKFAIENNRDYVTPEDIKDAFEINDVNTVRKDALKILGNTTGFGVEDSSLFAFIGGHS